MLILLNDMPSGFIVLENNVPARLKQDAVNKMCNIQATSQITKQFNKQHKPTNKQPNNRTKKQTNNYINKQTS
jgi:hypothetical protein